MGEAVGSNDESSEGAFEDGTALGSMVGGAVGSSVGSTVGAGVGSAVGEPVVHRRWIVSTAERSIGDREAMAGRTHLEYRALYLRQRECNEKKERRGKEGKGGEGWGEEWGEEWNGGSGDGRGGEGECRWHAGWGRGGEGKERGSDAHSFLHVVEQLAAEAADDPPVAHAEMSI